MAPTDPSSNKPGAAVWCNTWLGQSETFVANMIADLQRYRPVKVGIRTLEDPLLRPDHAPHGFSRRAELAGRLIGAGLVPPTYLRLLAEREVAVVHSHYGPDSFYAAHLADRAKLPLLAMFHGYDVTALPPAGTRGGRAFRRRLEYVFEHATLLLAVSDFIADTLVSLGAPEHKLRRHYIGIPTDRPAPATTGRSGIVFTGRFVEKKGVADLLRAVALLPEPLRSVPVRLIGYGALDGQLRALAATLAIDVEFLGPRTSAQVSEILNSAAIFCAPSRTASTGDSEGFGMVFAEAALAGLPVVAYRHGGVVEAVADGETGLLVAEGDVSALSGALAELLTDPARAERLGAAGRARVLADFDVATNTVALEKLYDEAVAIAGSSR